MFTWSLPPTWLLSSESPTIHGALTQSLHWVSRLRNTSSSVDQLQKIIKELAPMNAFKRGLYIVSKNLHVVIWQSTSQLIMSGNCYPTMWYTLWKTGVVFSCGNCSVGKTLRLETFSSRWFNFINKHKEETNWYCYD